MSIVARPYGPDSSPEEVAELRDRVKLRSARVIFLWEVPIMTAFEVGVCLGRVEELLDEHPGAALIVDVSESERPDAPTREALTRWLVHLAPKLNRLAVVTGKNFLINVTAKFVISGMPQKVTLHKTIAAAEEALGA